MPHDDVDDGAAAAALAALRARVEAQSWDAHHERRQQVLNALPVPPRRLQRDGRIPVTARIVWERDGAELVDTHAIGWTARAVLVEVFDHWWHLRGVWVAPGDVRRR